MNTTEILEKTKKLVSESRHDTHGDKVINHENISRLWTAYLQNKFKLNLVILPEDVACLMSLLKLARTQAGKLNLDDFQKPNYKRHDQIGWNYRLSEFSAAIALAQLEKIDNLLKN